MAELSTKVDYPLALVDNAIDCGVACNYCPSPALQKRPANG
jgi:Pyruvate/2-oxoacid:ferredoxin oxidoreductase delta subunit